MGDVVVKRGPRGSLKCTGCGTQWNGDPGERCLYCNPLLNATYYSTNQVPQTIVAGPYLIRHRRDM